MTSLTVTVNGMSCTGCEQRIATALRRLDGVTCVDADHATGVVAVEYNRAAVGEAEIIQRLAAAGYELTKQASR